MTSSNISHRVDQVAENAYLKIIARVSLPVLAFVGIQAWGDLKDQGRVVDEIRSDQKVAASKLEDALRRIDSLEDFQRKIMYNTQKSVP